MLHFILRQVDQHRIVYCRNNEKIFCLVKLMKIIFVYDYEYHRSNQLVFWVRELFCRSKFWNVNHMNICHLSRINENIWLFLIPDPVPYISLVVITNVLTLLSTKIFISFHCRWISSAIIQCKLSKSVGKFFNNWTNCQ